MRRIGWGVALAAAASVSVAGPAWAPTMGCAAVGGITPSCSYVAAGTHGFEASTDAPWRITGAGGRVLAEGPGGGLELGDPPVQGSAHAASFGAVPAIEGEMVTITLTGNGVVRGGSLGSD